VSRPPLEECSAPPSLTVRWGIPLVAGLSFIAACISVPSLDPIRVTLSPVAIEPLARMGPVTVAPLVDARPAALRSGYGPYVQFRYAGFVPLPMIGSVYFEGSRVEGPSLLGDGDLRLGGPGSSAAPPGAMAALVVGLLERASGHPVQRLARPLELRGIELGIERSGVSDGVIAVPILDQLDVTSLMSIRSSHAEAYHDDDGESRVSSAGDSSGGGPPHFANCRLRMLVIRRAGGVTTSRHMIHARGFGSDVRAAVEQAGAEVARGLVAIFGDPAPVAPRRTTPSSTRGPRAPDENETG